MDLNKVQLIGRLTKDPEVKQTQGGKTMAMFSVATGKSWKNEAGEKQEKTEFHNVVVFGKVADVVNMYCKKGKQVYVEGELQTRSWDDPTGKKNYRTEVIVSNVILLGGFEKQGDPQQAHEVKQHVQSVVHQQEEISVDEIPF